jgi:hypothetical protein
MNFKRPLLGPFAKSYYSTDPLNTCLLLAQNDMPQWSL